MQNVRQLIFLYTHDPSGTYRNYLQIISQNSGLTYKSRPRRVFESPSEVFELGLSLLLPMCKRSSDFQGKNLLLMGHKILLNQLRLVGHTIISRSANYTSQVVSRIFELSTVCKYGKQYVFVCFSCDSHLKKQLNSEMMPFNLMACSRLV